MSKITVNLPITKFFDPEGRHTCAVDVTTTKGVCLFYTTVKMGTIETCTFSQYSVPLERRGQDGLLIPGKYCPLRDAVAA